MQEILNFLNGVPAEFWTQLIDFIMLIVLPAIAVSPVALAFKKWWKIHSEKIMVFLVGLGSLLATIVTFALSSPDFPLPVAAGLTFATTQPVYYFFIKPLYLRINKWFTVQVAEAAKLNETKSAEVPATGLPIGNSDKTV